MSTFMALIRTCKLPGSVIEKLKLEFPKSRSSKRYGAVEFHYGREEIASHGETSAGGSVGGHGDGGCVGGGRGSDDSNSEDESGGDNSESDGIPSACIVVYELHR